MVLLNSMYGRPRAVGWRAENTKPVSKDEVSKLVLENANGPRNPGSELHALHLCAFEKINSNTKKTATFWVFGAENRHSSQVPVRSSFLIRPVVALGRCDTSKKIIEMIPALYEADSRSYKTCAVAPVAQIPSDFGRCSVKILGLFLKPRSFCFSPESCNMVLQLSAATAQDVEEIASLHLTAFDKNPLLHAQFPTRSSLDGLHKILSQEILHTVQHSQNFERAVIVVRDTEYGTRILGFAKWDLPGLRKDAPQLDVTWPNDCQREYLDEYYEKAEATKHRVVGDKPCYRLTFVGTLPDFRGRGIGTMLTRWGLAKAKKDNIPVYLESTIDASSLYRMLGFIAMDGLSMKIPGTKTDGEAKFYQEVGMLRTWEDDSMGMDRWDSSLNIASLAMDYEAGIKPQLVVEAIYERIEAYKSLQPSVWIHLQPLGEVMRAANDLLSRWPDPTDRPSLWGVPFSVKDSIDVVGIPTTGGCPPLASTPTTSAPVYQHCIDAGALFIGKTNMEQLATGMTGCRSVFGTLHSTFSEKHIVGGSSSGSAVTVSENLVSFSLGSDTAGSIRVPALFNGIVGFKPTKGTVSARGVRPACLHQDCVSFLTNTIEDAEKVWSICTGYDKEDVFAKLPSRSLPWSQAQKPNQHQFKFGVPPEAALEVCSPKYREQFSRLIDILTKTGGKLVAMDWRPFKEANKLLYEGSFVLERLTILPDGWFEKNKQLLHPVTRQVFEGALARKTTAIDVFKDLHKQAGCKRDVEDILTYDEQTGILSVMIVPTTPFHPTIMEVEADPLGINGKLGAFAHFANVLDLTGVAMPCGAYEIDEKEGEERTRLPFGVTILTGAGLDRELLDLAARLEDALRDLDELVDD